MYNFSSKISLNFNTQLLFQSILFFIQYKFFSYLIYQTCKFILKSFKYQNSQKSLKTKIFHHFMILVNKHMTMPYKSTPRIECFKWTTVIFRKLYPYHSDTLSLSVNSVSEYLFVRPWVLILSISVSFRVHSYWNVRESMFIRHTAINL